MRDTLGALEGLLAVLFVWVAFSKASSIVRSYLRLFCKSVMSFFWQAAFCNYYDLYIEKKELFSNLQSSLKSMLNHEFHVLISRCVTS